MSRTWKDTRRGRRLLTRLARAWKGRKALLDVFNRLSEQGDEVDKMLAHLAHQIVYRERYGRFISEDIAVITASMRK